MSQLNLPELEKEIQEHWSEKGVFRRVCEAKKGKKRFYFCQGPPFTSGHAHLGHAWNHTLKDMILRYKTMQGYDVFRRAGWDMHGLPIEVKVEEKVLGYRTKKGIEEYGIDNFIGECKRFAIQNMNVMTQQLQRLGVWLDWDDPYMTLDKRYMEGVWFGIKKAHEKNLLYEDVQVIHWCPRCETAMSGYEVREEYKEVSDPSIYVKAKLENKEGFILIWTTTPWTLPANVAIAVHPDSTYVKVNVNKEILILAKDRLEVLEDEYKILEEFKGKDLEGLKYESFLDIPLQKIISCRVITSSEFVTMEEGTGCVHIAPGHGEEDFTIGKLNDLEVLSPVDGQGKFRIDPYNGIYIRDANGIIINDLEENNKLFRETTISHRYAHCWRCKSPLILRSTKQWFLAVSKIRDELLDKNKEIEWIPDWIGTGRFENWLSNAKDWCISRQRYWNTPLPVWRCDCGQIKVIGSIEELIDNSVERIDIETLDLHRPAIDEVKLRCECGREMSRVKDVMDVWLDSGSASWANLGYPQEKELFEELFPIDFITEGSDQTRGWFYSLLVGSVIAFDQIPYKRVLYHGFTLDSEGKKMSKSLGNIINPLDIADEYGADVLRFYMLYTTPWEDLRFSMDGIGSVYRTLNILWNVHNFARTYMELDHFDSNMKYKFTNLEDLWILSRFNSLLKDATDSMEKVHPHEATRQIQEFIFELSHWYVKLARDRVWSDREDPGKLSAYYTLHYILTNLAKLMAPITPHLSEQIYSELTGEESVHLCDWPVLDEDRIDTVLESRMAVAKQIIECVSAARQKANIKLRWPIKRVIVASKGDIDLGGVEDIILQMSNAKELKIEDIEKRTAIKPNYQIMGPKFKDRTPEIVKRLDGIDAEQIKAELDSNEKYTLDELQVTLTKEDLIFETQLPVDVVAEEFDGGVVYIDKKLDTKLYSEAMGREVIRRIQEMRKELKLNELEVVNVSIKCDTKFKGYIRSNKKSIEHETRSKIKFGGAKGAKGFKKVWKIEKNKLEIVIVRSRQG